MSSSKSSSSNNNNSYNSRIAMTRRAPSSTASAAAATAAPPQPQPPHRHFGAVISERAPDAKELAASQELQKFLTAMGLYEDEAGSKRRKVCSLDLLAGIISVSLSPQR